jgi:hypothetical protein
LYISYKMVYNMYPMKHAKIAVAFYSVLVVFFLTEHYAFAKTPPGLEEDQSGDKLASVADYQVKDRFMIIFSEYCKWPPQSSVSTTGTPFTIGAFEENDVISYLIETFKSRTIVDKKSQILIISDFRDIEKCNLLYITESSGKQLQKIFDSLKKHPILTISDIPGDAEKGVMIEMFIVNNKMHYIVNLSAVRKNELLLNSTILKYADKVIED